MAEGLILLSSHRASRPEEWGGLAGAVCMYSYTVVKVTTPRLGISTNPGRVKDKG